MNIEYRDHSTRYPRVVRSVEAVLGGFSGRGKNKTEAKAALLEAISEQGRYLYSRRYLVGPKATFCLHYCQGWMYDIASPGSSRRYSSTGLGCDLTEEEAFERMERHFQQYHEGG